MIHYDEPEFGRVTLPIQDAVRLQKLSGEGRGHVYESDMQALDDFLIIHWAWIE